MTASKNTDIRALLNRAYATKEENYPSLLSFEGREDYLAFVSAWKADYRGVVEEIRELKAQRGDKSLPIPVRVGANLERQSLRHEARTLIGLRLAGKGIARAHHREKHSAKAA